jgi:chemotaxis protein histidine kinase CheA
MTTTTTTFTNTENLRASHQRVLAAREAAAHATAAAERARKSYQAALTENERLDTQEQEWIARQAQRLASHYAQDSNRAAPALMADAKVLQARASASANTRATAAAVAQLEAAEQAARGELAEVEQALEAAYRANNVEHAVQLMDELAEMERGIEELRARIASQQFASEMHGVSGAFTGLLSPEQLIALDSLPPRIPVAELFASRRHVVRDINTAIGTAPTELAAHLAYWRTRQQALEVVAAGGNSSESAEAA